MEAAVDPVTSQVRTRHDLVAAALAGDRGAFAQLVDPWLEPALAASIAVTRSHADAADAVQDALLAAWQGLDRLRDPAAFPAWFRTHVVRSALRVARRRGRLVELDLGGVTGDDGLDGALDRRMLGLAYDRLEADDRLLLTLRYLWDLPVAEVAAGLGIPPGTVKSRTHAAIDRLRAAFEAESRR